MRRVLPIRWDLSVDEAEALQRRGAALVETQDRLGPVRTVAGVDVAYEKGGDRVFAAVVVLDAATLEVLDEATHEERVRFPYIPGLFSFRELPPIATCFEALRTAPDLVVCDGQGRAHPRRFGLACHLGVLFDLPAIGCAKTLLVGSHAPLGHHRADPRRRRRGRPRAAHAGRRPSGLRLGRAPRRSRHGAAMGAPPGPALSPPRDDAARGSAGLRAPPS